MYARSNNEQDHKKDHVYLKHMYRMWRNQPADDQCEAHYTWLREILSAANKGTCELVCKDVSIRSVLHMVKGKRSGR
jgi:hypothetical protein